MEKKSIILALILAFLFGPLGLLYATLGGALFLIVFFLVLLVVMPVAVVALAPVFWGLSIIMAVVATADHNGRVSAYVQRKQAEQNARIEAHEKQWTTLLEYDEDAGRAAQMLAEYGESAQQELRRVYQVVNDPAKLPVAAEKIIQNIKAEKDRLRALGRYIVSAEKASEALSERGIDNPNVPGERGNRPLHKAAEAGDLELIGLLLSAGAVAYETNMGGFTPAELARRAGHAEVAELIDMYQTNAA